MSCSPGWSLLLLDNVSICPQVVAFVKGTRTAPQCGFSHRVLTLLNESRAEYEVLDASWIQNPYAKQDVVCQTLVRLVAWRADASARLARGVRGTRFWQHFGHFCLIFNAKA